jgi:alkylhydroperoxidase family enzyme
MARVPYLSSSEASGEVAKLLAQLEERGVSMRVLQAVSNSSGAARNFARLGSALIRYTKLDDRLRELVILHLSVELGAPYEWFEHEPIARGVGVTDPELAALRERDVDAAVFDDRDREVLRFAVLVVRREVDDAAWARITSHLDTEEATDLVLSAAWWGGMVPALVAALQIEPPTA